MKCNAFANVPYRRRNVEEMFNRVLVMLCYACSRAAGCPQIMDFLVEAAVLKPLAQSAVTLRFRPAVMLAAGRVKSPQP